MDKYNYHSIPIPYSGGLVGPGLSLTLPKNNPSFCESFPSPNNSCLVEPVVFRISYTKLAQPDESIPCLTVSFLAQSYKIYSSQNLETVPPLLFYYCKLLEQCYQ